MKWYTRALVYALRETVQPALSSFGTKIGEALGTKVGKKIEPTFEPTPKEASELEKE